MGEAIEQASDLASGAGELRGGRLGRVLGLAGQAGGVIGAGLQLPQAIRQAITDPSSENLTALATTGTSFLSGAADSTQRAANALTRSRARSLVDANIRAAAPGISDELRQAAADRAARGATTGGANAGQLQVDVMRELRDVQRGTPTTLAQGTGTASRTEALDLLRRSSGDAASSALDFVSNSRLGRLGRAAGRVVPGLNVAATGLDLAAAYRSWTNPNASWGRTIVDTVTAAGSVASLVPFPPVALAGTAISLLGSAVGMFVGE